MSVKFNIVERANPRDLEAPKKFYPSIQSSGRKSVRQLTQLITQMCTVTGPDTMAVLESFLTIIPQELAEGNIVELGDFGSFSRRIPGRCGCAAAQKALRRWSRSTEIK
jgi:hypothetical protein